MLKIYLLASITALSIISTNNYPIQVITALKNSHHVDLLRPNFSQPGKKGMTWSILIPTIPSRKALFARIYRQLTQQIRQAGLGDKVEILVHRNVNKTIGQKRNELIARSQAEYINFFDDDDEADHEYIIQLFNALRTHPDCVRLYGISRNVHRPDEYFIHSNQYTSYGQVQRKVTYRPPTHLNPIQRSIASRFPFPHKNFGEDSEWSLALVKAKVLKKEAVPAHKKPLYIYHNRHRTVER